MPRGGVRLKQSLPVADALATGRHTHAAEIGAPWMMAPTQAVMRPARRCLSHPGSRSAPLFMAHTSWRSVVMKISRRPEWTSEDEQIYGRERMR